MVQGERVERAAGLVGRERLVRQRRVRQPPQHLLACEQAVHGIIELEHALSLGEGRGCQQPGGEDHEESEEERAETRHGTASGCGGVRGGAKVTTGTEERESRLCPPDLPKIHGPGANNRRAAPLDGPNASGFNRYLSSHFIHCLVP